MNTISLKNKIFQAIENIDDAKILTQVLAIVSRPKAADRYNLNDEDLAIIEERKSQYESGKMESFSVQEIVDKVKRSRKK